MVAATSSARLRLCLCRSGLRQTNCLIVRRDQHATIRLAAAMRLEQMMDNPRHRRDSAASPTGYRRIRLIQLLTIQDALDLGANAHDLAFGLIFERNRPIIGAAWKGSGERRHTLRLIAETRRMVTSGYRKLLQHK
jgi:Uncharacterized conserved protein (DUF2285)